MSQIRRNFLGRAFPLLSNYVSSLAGYSIYLFAINWFFVSQTQSTSLLVLI
ncbi:MFS transporter, partial [Streptococcus agalactiae]